MGKSLKGQTLIQAFESWVPKSLAFEGDRIGLQVGTLNKEIKNVMVTLDVLENVVDEAVEKDIDLIVAHHAVIFKPLKDMRTDRGQSRIVAKLIKHDIAVYVAHTNLDIAAGGINDMMAEQLGLTDVDVLVPTQTESLYKVALFVPETHADNIRRALGDAGAGFIGDYSHCTFNTPGTGTFIPQEGTTPYIGEQGKLERVKEVKIETIVPESIRKQVIRKMIMAHPYEEPAYDVYPLENEGHVHGLGRIGSLKEQVGLQTFAEQVKRTFGLDGIRVTGDLHAPVKRVAVLSGDGNDFMKHAAFKGADVLITGDVYYHTAHDAILEDLNLIDAGHHVEKVMKTGVKDYLRAFVDENGYDAQIFVSEANTNPFTFL